MAGKAWLGAEWHGRQASHGGGSILLGGAKPDTDRQAKRGGARWGKIPRDAAWHGLAGMAERSGVLHGSAWNGTDGPGKTRLGLAGVAQQGVAGSGKALLGGVRRRKYPNGCGGNSAPTFSRSNN